MAPLFGEAALVEPVLPRGILEVNQAAQASCDNLTSRCGKKERPSRAQVFLRQHNHNLMDLVAKSRRCHKDSLLIAAPLQYQQGR